MFAINEPQNPPAMNEGSTNRSLHNRDRPMNPVQVLEKKTTKMPAADCQRARTVIAVDLPLQVVILHHLHLRIFLNHRLLLRSRCVLHAVQAGTAQNDGETQQLQPRGNVPGLAQRVSEHVVDEDVNDPDQHCTACADQIAMHGRQVLRHHLRGVVEGHERQRVDDH